MAHINTVFSQLIKYVPKDQFQKFVNARQGDKRCRQLFCWDQFVAMLFGQLSGAQSLRDLVERLASQQRRLYHLGIRPIRKSSLADANQSRPSEVYYDLFFHLYAQLAKQEQKHLQDSVRLLDSTTITLSQTQYQWAEFRSQKAGIKLHTLYDPEADTPVFFEMTDAKMHDSVPVGRWPMMQGTTYVFDRAYNSAEFLRGLIDAKALFVGRMKSSTKYRTLSTMTPQGDGVLSDELIEVQINPTRCSTVRRLGAFAFYTPRIRRYWCSSPMT